MTSYFIDVSLAYYATPTYGSIYVAYYATEEHVAIYPSVLRLRIYSTSSFSKRTTLIWVTTHLTADNLA